MPYTSNEILQTIRMVEMEALDIRTVTMGICLLDCSGPTVDQVANNVYEKIVRAAGNLVPVATEIESRYGIPIINKRIAITPISHVAAGCDGSDYVPIAQAIDRAAVQVGVNFVGGFSALVHKGFSVSDKKLIDSIPQAIAATERVNYSVSVGSTKAGINMDAVRRMAEIVQQTAQLTAEAGGIGCARLVVFCNMPEDNPFMAGAMHGVGEPERVINVGVSGPGVVRYALEKLGPEAPLTDVCNEIKRITYKITRAGELVGREAAQKLDCEFGIIDLSLAPTPAVGDSVADILEIIGVEKCGTHGTTAALAMLTDAVKKGGAMAATRVGGLSGAFIPVSEDAGMVAAVKAGALSLDKLEAMTSVCSVGLDMVAIPGDTPVDTIAGIIADEMAIGMINNKTTAARLIPVPGKGPGETVEFGGLLGTAIVQAVNPFSSTGFIRRGGTIPPPINSLKN